MWKFIENSFIRFSSVITLEQHTSTMRTSLVTGLLALVISFCQGQRTPTISYITPPITTKMGGTIEMDCSVLYGTEYPILWVKLPGHCEAERVNYDIRAQVADACTPVPLSSGSALIVRDNRFRYYAPIIRLINQFSMTCALCIACPQFLPRKSFWEQIWFDGKRNWWQRRHLVAKTVIFLPLFWAFLKVESV